MAHGVVEDLLQIIARQRAIVQRAEDDMFERHGALTWNS